MIAFIHRILAYRRPPLLRQEVRQGVEEVGEKPVGLVGVDGWFGRLWDATPMPDKP